VIADKREIKKANTIERVGELIKPAVIAERAKPRTASNMPVIMSLRNVSWFCF